MLISSFNTTYPSFGRQDAPRKTIVHIEPPIDRERNSELVGDVQKAAKFSRPEVLNAGYTRYPNTGQEAQAPIKRYRVVLNGDGGDVLPDIEAACAKHDNRPVIDRRY